MIRVAIIGATGYTASESIKIILRHPQAKLTYLTALPNECGHITDIFPMFQGQLNLEVEPIDLDKLSQVADVALCCLPHKVSMDFVPKLLSAGVKVVDFSADYRIHDPKYYEAIYKVAHSDPDNCRKAVFGLPELFRSNIAAAGVTLIANPGCYPTAASLGLAPLLANKLIATDDIVVNAVSGVSGAGRKAALPFHFPEMVNNLYAYAVGNHRHMPEIEQILTDLTGEPIEVLFQPHVVSMDRGIGESIYCRPLTDMGAEDLLALYADFYTNEPFVRLKKTPPMTRDVSNTNFCDIHVTRTKGKIVVFSAIDNLIKGAAGQAVQNMNIICGLPETAGLL